MKISAHPLPVAVGLRRGCFPVLPALFAGAFLLAANLRGEFVYVANIGDGTISGYTIGTDGNLTPINGSPFTTGGEPSTVGVDTAGGFLYASLESPGAIAAFSIGAEGALTPVPGSPFSVGENVLSLAVDSHGGFVYATAETNPYFTNGVFAYSIGSSGSLTLITESPFKTGHEPFGITVDQNGKFVYVCNSMSNTVWGYHIESTGGLRKIFGDPFPVGS
jgi:6-phosphogluconolactonase (cycloisomerase 2 family)